MKFKLYKGVLLSVVPLLTVGPAAWGGDGGASVNGVSVNITNDGTEDLLVTVYDETAGPNVVVLSHTRINGFTTVPVSVSPDDTGRANLSWNAITADSHGRKCGHADDVKLRDSSSLTVHADGRCGSSN